MARLLTPAQQARKDAGLSVREAAKRTCYSPEAVRLAERGGGRASWRLACALATIYKCSANVFLNPEGGDTPAISTEHDDMNMDQTNARA